MSPQAHCCRPDDRLSAAARLMWEHDCGCVPVVDERNVLVGMITDRDACMAAYTRGLRLDEIPVHTVMTRRAFSCKADDTLEAAEVLMRSHQVRRLPVVDQTNKVVGLLSSNDLLRGIAQVTGSQRAVLAEQLVSLMASIGTPRQLGAGQRSTERPTVPTAAGTAAGTPAVALPRPNESNRTETKAAESKVTETRPQATDARDRGSQDKGSQDRGSQGKPKGKR
jgi:predicted transcriptional regulator